MCAHRDIFSICESSCLKLIQNNASIFGHLSRNFLLRTTPNITRVDSSNMNPQEFWNFGINLCAMNYQTPGLMMDLQEVNLLFKEFLKLKILRANLQLMGDVVMC